jgi:ureidoglycolate dehydrogenase (NAD+)
MSEEVYRVAADALTHFAAALFEAAGVPDDHAATVAEVLVWANLRGVDSHGVLRIPGYLARLDSGVGNARPDMRIAAETPAALVIDADYGLGPVGMKFAMERTIPKAREAGIGWGLVRNTTHAAAVGYYALMAAREHMAGLVLVGSVPNMAYFGARAAGVSTGAIAIAVPGAAHAPLMLDMASAIASIGKLAHARDAGHTLPEGWALDADGNPTTDAGRAVLPMPLGGPKGAGLALLIECLTSLMVGNPLIETGVSGSNRRHRQNALVVAVDIEAFRPVADFEADVDALAAIVKGLPTAEGVDEILVPGERGDRVLESRARDGIPLAAGTWERLAESARARDVPKPDVVRETLD